MGRTTPTLPWRDGDLLMLCAMTAVGLVVIVSGWYGAGGAASVTGQAAWVNVAVTGTVISGVGNCVWLLKGRRAVGERRAELVALRQAPAAVPARRESQTAPLPGLVRGYGMHRVHRPDCPLLAGKGAEPARPGDGDPCGVCLP